MRGTGGPLLCIGDLLADLDEDSGASSEQNATSAPSSPPGPSSISHIDITSQSVDLSRLFEENYKKLNEAFSDSGHAWTALTLELCKALETANSLVGSTNTNARLLLEKVEELNETIKKGDSTVAAARALHASLNQSGRPSRADKSIQQV